MIILEHTAAHLYDLGYRKGHSIYIDGKPVTWQALKSLTGTYTFVREEDKNAVSRNIYLKTASQQRELF